MISRISPVHSPSARRGALLTALLGLAGGLWSPRADARHTPAGTTLTATAQAIFTDSSIQAVGAVPAELTVAKQAAINVAMPHTSDTLSGAKAYPFTVENDGNYTGDLTLALSATSNMAASIVRDNNANGVMDPDDTTVLTSVTDLTPGDVAHCLLVVKPASASVAGQKATATVNVTAPDDPTAQAQVNFAATFVRPLTPIFSFHAPEPLNSSPTVLNGVALVGSDLGVLYAVKALGADAGKLAWRYPAKGNVGGAIRGRVATDGANYYFTANNGMAYCLDGNGKLVWQSQAAPSSVCLEAMPVVTSTSVTLACGDGRLRRLDKTDGEVITVSAQMGTGSLTTPAVPMPGELWVGGSDGNLYSLNDEAGFTVLSSRRISGKPVSATPFVEAHSGIVLSATSEGNVYAMKSHSNQALWGPVPLSGPVQGSPWVDGRAGIAYFAGTDNTVNALHTMNGSWVPGFPIRMADAGGFAGSPVVVPVTGGSLILAASTSGRLYGINTMQPNSYVQFDPPETATCFTGSPAVSGMSLNDVVVAAGADGNLYGFALKDALPQ